MINKVSNKLVISFFVFLFMIFSVNSITDTNLVFYSSADTQLNNPSNVFGGVTDSIGILGRGKCK